MIGVVRFLDFSWFGWVWFDCVIVLIVSFGLRLWVLGLVVWGFVVDALVWF